MTVNWANLALYCVVLLAIFTTCRLAGRPLTHLEAIGVAALASAVFYLFRFPYLSINE